MKNVKIIVGVLMALMISYIKAEEFNINFDGKRETLNIKDFKWNNLINTNIIPIPLKETIEGDKYLSVKDHSSNQCCIKDNNKTLLSSVDFSIISSIKHCEENKVNKEITYGLKKLLVCGSEEEKKEFVTNPQYTIPYRLNTLRLDDDIIRFNYYKGVTPVCMKWETKEVCISKEVCEQVCDTTTLICALWNPEKTQCLVWGFACRTICRWKPECTNIPQCVEWYSDVY